MFQYVDQVVTNCVCLLFGIGQVVYSGFFKLFRWTAACCDRKPVSQNSRREFFIKKTVALEDIHLIGLTQKPQINFR